MRCVPLDIDLGAGCWAHSRRKFFDAVKLNPDDAVSTRIVKRIDELFAIDAMARAEKLDHAGRQVLRLERAQPLVEIIRGEVEAARDASLPSSALGKAANYTLSQWGKLTRFLEHAELELSNNLADRGRFIPRKCWPEIADRQPGWAFLPFRASTHLVGRMSSVATLRCMPAFLAVAREAQEIGFRGRRGACATL